MTMKVFLLGKNGRQLKQFEPKIWHMGHTTRLRWEYTDPNRGKIGLWASLMRTKSVTIYGMAVLHDNGERVVSAFVPAKILSDHDTLEIKLDFDK